MPCLTLPSMCVTTPARMVASITAHCAQAQAFVKNGSCTSRHAAEAKASNDGWWSVCLQTVNLIVGCGLLL